MIELTYGGSFDEKALVAYIRKTAKLEGCIVQGQSVASYDDHPKKLSLDYWIRSQKGVAKNTKQADNEVMRKLVRSKLFKEVKVKCPETGRPCKGLKLT